MVRLAGYRLVTQLGEGGMGRAHLARSASGRLVVVKTVHAHLAAEPGFRERLRRESAAARAVEGPFTAAVLDADPDARQPWLAVEYCAGPSLSEAVAALGPLGSGDLAALGAALAEALAAVHGAGLLHRDLKPANVVVTGDGPKVIDFGIAKVMDPAAGEETLTATGEIVGSPGFMAPEQISRDTEPGPAADVFALGALLALAATGRGPHGSGTAPQVLYRTLHKEPDLLGVPDARWDAFLTRCLAKSPDDRPTVPEILAWCATRAATPPWWERPAFTSVLRNHEDEIAERVAAAEEEEEGETAEETAVEETPSPRPTPANALGRLSRRRLLTWTGAALATAATATTAAFLLDENDTDGKGSASASPRPWKKGTSVWTREVGALEYGGSLTRHGEALYVQVDGTVTCLDPVTNSLRWRFEDASALVPRGDTVYVLRQGDAFTPSFSTRIAALDAATGEIRWETDPILHNPYRRAAAGETDGETDGDHASFVVSERTVCLVTYASYDTIQARRAAQGRRWRAYGYGITRGEALWFRAGTPAEVIAMHAAGGRFALALNSTSMTGDAPPTGPLMVLSERKGTVESRVSGGAARPEAHRGATGTRYYATQRAVQCVDLATGHVRWSKPPGQAGVTPAAAHGLVHAATSEGVGALDAATGGKRWWRDDVRGLAGAEEPPLREGGLLYVAGPDPDGAPGTSGDWPVWGVHALHAATGEPAWAVPADGLSGEVIAAAGGGLLHLSTGRTLQTFRGPGSA
ncbi:PQQ-binding-like beta-propeller repeat protein [Streptomyces sp. NPDC059866]|uniref:protein kinase domain-containing protein n=1 Tax=Streptomyces sp. NPDC059866 TaxID=3346978 RepID=UPI00365693D6